jgi:2-dehydro-3-deoxyphosphogluconate aldolase/(4S)-4-hydroxy-2-oxoglutarate aldolase
MRAEKLIRETGIVAIVRGDYQLRRVLGIAAALEEGGVRVMEVTLNSRGALEAIEALRERSPNSSLIGAGTVRTPADVGRALEAGAQFLVSPGVDQRSVASSREAGVLHLPGVFTATEVQLARSLGCRMVKLFPAAAGGPGYLKALRAPLDDVDFVPTGGVSPENAEEYLRAGAVALGVGSELVGGPHEDLDEITERASRLAATFRQVRGTHGGV